MFRCYSKMDFRLVISTFALFFLFISSGIAAEAKQSTSKSKIVFRAGAATSNITPPLGELVVGGWSPTPAKNIHDELHARCLVLDDGTTTIAIVVCDILYLKREVCDKAREYIVKETNLPPENILIAGTHTHSATINDSKNYGPFLSRRIADSVRRALENRVDAEIGWGSAQVPEEVFNRRWYMNDSKAMRNPFGGVDLVRMNPSGGSKALLKQSGTTDPEVSFISVRTTDGTPLCLLANYSLHYVGGVNKGEVSADYFGYFARRIAELLGEGSMNSNFVGILSNGTSGDINNIDFSKRRTRNAPYIKMQQVANLVAGRVFEANKKIKYKKHVSLGAVREDLVLKVRKPDEKMQKYFAKVMEKSDDAPKFHRYEKVYAGRVQKLLDGPDEYNIMLQAIKIGDLSIAAIPFEVFVEIGLEIKKETPFADAFTIELANGANGYLPTPSQHDLGGYETWMGTNRVQKDASDLITAKILELMTKLKAE